MSARRFSNGDDQVMTGADRHDGAVLLSHANVSALQPSERRFTVWDLRLKGFGLRVEPSGRKTFVIRYRASGGGRRGVLRQMAIGTADALSCAAARMRAEQLLASVKLGADPVNTRKEERIAPTIGDLLGFYVDVYAASANLRPATRRDARNIFDLYVLPRWRLVRVAEVDVARARALHGEILQKAGPNQANRALAYLSSAIENGWRSDNPLRMVRKSPQDARTRVLGDEIYHTYSAYARGTEGIIGAYAMLDMTPYGRQQEFEDSPTGWPQAPTYG